MVKVVVYALLTTAFVAFLVISPIRQHNQKHLSLLGRRLKQLPVPTFDPLVSKMKRLAEEQGSSNEIDPDNLQQDFHIVEDSIKDEYEYFNNDGKLNITLRLLILFPFLDNAPKDGVISFQELEAWNIKQAIDRLSYTTEKELESLDKNGDGAISFEEYVPLYFKEGEMDNNGMGSGQAGWWKQQFVNADVDGSGTLNFEEFNNFLHPEDSNNGVIQKWLLKEKMERMDHDNDGKLNFTEFLENTYEIYKTYVEIDEAKLPTAEQKFAQLDVNKDNFLEVEELKPIFRYLHPGELSYAKYYTAYLIQEADENRDGNLTLEEMLDHDYIFYNTVYNENNDQDDYDTFRDEL